MTPHPNFGGFSADFRRIFGGFRRIAPFPLNFHRKTQEFFIFRNPPESVEFSANFRRIFGGFRRIAQHNRRWSLQSVGFLTFVVAIRRISADFGGFGREVYGN